MNRIQYYGAIGSILLFSACGEVTTEDSYIYNSNKIEEETIINDSSDTSSTDDNSSANTQIDSTKSDSDGDGIPDNIESFIGMNPNVSDEDGDGILDGLQIDGSYGDSFFDKQWYIKSLGTVINDSGVATIAGNDMNLASVYSSYMGYNSGKPIIVQVVDDGVDADHEDLSDNMDLSRSYKHTSLGFEVGNPSPTMDYSLHGTMIAGIIAARAFNGKGVRGIAPFAKIAGSNWMETQTYSGLERVWLTGIGANEIAISNNSWGSYIDNDTFYEKVMQKGTSTLRDGKGRIYLFASGNSRGEYGFGNSNLEYSLSNRFGITVAALKHDNTHSSYSTAGGNILISGYGGDFYENSPTMATTINEGKSSNSGDTTYTDQDISNDKTTWATDTKENYTFMMNGTSAATPTVAGSVALLLEACPSLTWRDVKYLIAKHGNRVDKSNPSWQKNGAGLWHSVDYGYGLIDTKGMIADCTSGYKNLPKERSTKVSVSLNNYALADGDSKIFDGIEIKESMKIEWIEITLDADHAQPSDLRIELQSPAGTTSRVLDWNRATSDLYGAWMSGGFRVGAAGFIGEDSAGEWKVRVTDFNIKNENISGILKNLEIKIYGH